jgi:SAM-dependent methyltransferase
LNPVVIMLLALGLVALAGLLWWLLVTTEGVYLGRGVVVWLYDVYAGRYDRIKAYEPEYEHALLAVPIMQMIDPHRSPLVLDVATGTGRLPDALLNHVHFQGRVVGLDLSRRMLAVAADKMAADGERVAWLWGPAEKLPFADRTFDVVTCLESLEFMRDPARVLAEMARVLRPDGLLLITNRLGTWTMPGKLFSETELTAVLEGCGIGDVLVEPWQEDYQRVWGIKGGTAAPTGARPLAEVLHCPRCGTYFDGDWRCPGCGGTLNRDADGVWEINRLYR